MGIEPTYAAWEAAVLPLNYTRPNLREKTQSSPGGDSSIIPVGFAILQTLLTKSHQMEVSTLSRWGNRFIPYPRHYNEAFAFSILLYPLRLRLILRPT